MDKGLELITLGSRFVSSSADILTKAKCKKRVTMFVYLLVYLSIFSYSPSSSNNVNNYRMEEEDFIMKFSFLTNTARYLLYI